MTDLKKIEKEFQKGVGWAQDQENGPAPGPGEEAAERSDGWAPGRMDTGGMLGDPAERAHVSRACLTPLKAPAPARGVLAQGGGGTALTPQKMTVMGGRSQGSLGSAVRRKGPRAGFHKQ